MQKVRKGEIKFVKNDKTHKESNRPILPLREKVYGDWCFVGLVTMRKARFLAGENSERGKRIKRSSKTTKLLEKRALPSCWLLFANHEPQVATLAKRAKRRKFGMGKIFLYLGRSK